MTSPNKKQKTERNANTAAASTSAASSSSASSVPASAVASKWPRLPLDLLVAAADWLLLRDAPSILRTCKAWRELDGYRPFWNDFYDEVCKGDLFNGRSDADHIERAFAPERLSLKALLRETVLARRRYRDQRNRFFGAYTPIVEVVPRPVSSSSASSSSASHSVPASAPGALSVSQAVSQAVPDMVRITCPAVSLKSLEAEVYYAHPETGIKHRFTSREYPMRVNGRSSELMFASKWAHREPSVAGSLMAPIDTFTFDLPLVVPDTKQPSDGWPTQPAGTRVSLADVWTIRLELTMHALEWSNEDHFDVVRFVQRLVRQPRLKDDLFGALSEWSDKLEVMVRSH